MHRLNRIIYLIAFMALCTTGVQSQENLTVSSALAKGLENNYGIILSQSREEIARLNNHWGEAGRYPTIGFTAASSNSMELIDPSATNRLSGGVGMNWILFDGYRVHVTKSRLSRLENLAQGRSAVVVENTIQDVILGYYNVLLQKEQLEVLERVMKLSRDRYNYEVMRKEIGSSLSYHVLQAKNVYLEDSASFLNQQVVVRNSIRNLNFVLGEDPSVRWAFTESFQPDTSQYQLGSLLDKMLSGNQTLQNQYVNLMLSQDQVKLSQSELYPTLSLSAGLDNGWSRRKNQGMAPVTGETVTPYGNLSLSYNIYSGGTRKRAVEVARVNEQIAQTETEEIKHSLINVLYNEYDRYNVRSTLLEVADENLEAAELNLKIAEDKFRTGAINSFNYRDIQLIYINAALQRLRSVYNLIDSRTNLTRLIGGFVNEEA
ncbi:MAG TPA: TolC family protein [Bacteroidales bacterium]|nr:TolC family protein [Bacteroidales bacterium]